MNKETRYLEFEIRAEQSEEKGSVITGEPIVFGQITDLGMFRETIDVGSLDNTDLKDVRFLVGHDFSMVPLARSRNNNKNSTMQLTVNEAGMGIRVNLDTDNNPRAKELYSAIKRGDITGMSFAFTVDKDSWEDLDTESPLRHVRSVGRVFEVSAVAFPAYEGTSIQAASEGGALESAKASLESARKQAEEERAAAAEQERRRAVLEELNNLIGGNKNES